MEGPGHSGKDPNTVGKYLAPLAPRPSTGTPQTSSSGPRNTASNIVSASGRVAVKAACEECHARKVKCDGLRPRCSKCVKAGTECVYVTAAAESRRQAVKRKYEETTASKSAYEEFFELLKTRTPDEAETLLRQVHAGVPVADIVKRVRDGDLLLQLAVVPGRRYRYQLPYRGKMPSYLLVPMNSYLDTKLHEFDLWSDPSRMKPRPQDDAIRGQDAYWTPYHAARIVDPLIESVKPSTWTVVSSNDTFMRELLGAFFLLEYHALPIFQKEYFLQDMARGRRDCCSSLLTNAVLAWACFCDRRVLYRSEFWNPANMGYRFLAEARRLWDLDYGVDSLTTIQAAVVLNSISNMNGSDRLGLVYTTNALAMANRMCLFDAHETPGSAQGNARAFTAWVLYAWQGVVCYMYATPTFVKTPPRMPLPKPQEKPEWYGAIRLRYPTIETLYSTHFAEWAHAKIRLWCITAEIVTLSFENGQNQQKASSGAVWALYSRLRAWYDTLPEVLRPDQIVFPQQLQVHMQYHNCVINLFEEPTATELENDTELTQDLRHPHRSPRDILLESKRDLETLVRLYYLRHGFAASDSFMTHFLSFLLFITGNNIKTLTTGDFSDETLESLRSTLILAASGIRAQGEHHYFGRVVYRTVRGGLRAEELDLVDRFAELRYEETNPPPGCEMHSKWVNQFDRLLNTSTEQWMGELLKHYRESSQGLEH